VFRQSVLAVAAAAALAAFGYWSVAWKADAVEPLARPPQGKSWFVAPQGSTDGDGSRERPLSLATALAQESPVRPADTVWLTGGTYRGPFVSYLTGTQEGPIVVRQLPGVRATIDGSPSSDPTLYINGAWTTYWGFEVTNSSPHRPFGYPGFDKLTRGMNVEVRGPHTKLVNLTVHDGGGGLGIWSTAAEAEAHGNIIYYNGYESPDRGHGHGIYVQNEHGERRISENIIFSQFDHGIHAYGSSNAPLDHITLEGNVVFNNGNLDHGLKERRYSRNILLGGGRIAKNPILRQNYTYFSPGVRRGGDNNLGYSAGCSNLIGSENYFVGELPLVLGGGCSGTLTENVFHGPMGEAFKAQYPKNSYLADRPAGVSVFVRRNGYEKGRANIVIYNWDRWRHVRVDLKPAGLEPGTRFEIRDAQNFFGDPVLTGVYDGRPVTITMRGLSVGQPVEGIGAPPHSAPEFGAFVLLPSQS
jgi:parallel beta-helix repeat protein